MRDHHEVTAKGKVVYSGETFYSVEGDKVVFTYFNSTGGIGRGTVTLSGNKLHFTGSMRASPQEEAPQPIDSEWQIVDDRHYEVRSLVAPSTGGKRNPVLIFSRNN